MERRAFMAKAMTGAARGGGRPGRMETAPQGVAGDATIPKAHEVFIEWPVAGKLHPREVLAAIPPRADDIPIYAAGTVAQLLDEGYRRAKKDFPVEGEKSYGRN